METSDSPREPRAGVAKEKRISRACLACRQRKTKCDLGSDGVPPCSRCVSECLECVLAVSRRGGRRPRKSLHPPQSSDNLPTKQAGNESSQTRLSDASQSRSSRREESGRTRRPLQQTFGSSALSRDLIASQPSDSTTRRRSGSVGGDVEGEFTSRDLLNPSDALNLLAQVADLDVDPGGLRRRSSHGADRFAMDQGQMHGAPGNTPFYYPPISDGCLDVSDASYLLTHYHDHYHPFFPVADRRIFGGSDILTLAKDEPHLLTSILTVASKDDPSWSRVHEACSNHMNNIISGLICRGSTAVGAVEALLILAEWAPRKLQDRPMIGRGEEDQGAWMQIGVAIRLAYLQGLEQTGLHRDKSQWTEEFERKRIAWTACYMSDREVSIRLGKGFWSRGPGPSTILNATDFPTLRTQQAGPGNLALLFQARLELIQVFSNAHDILYSSTSHREQLYTGGEYVRYIDDFSAVLRKWKLVWGGLSFTPAVKAALILSYEFLRLYINAFAFQATINRAITCARQNQPSSRRPIQALFSDVAGTPDARFIYESIDAANSLLCTLNDFIDPSSGLRYMPLKYFLYVIYAAVFLFKARVSGALVGEAGSSTRRTINVTIDKLQKSSVSPNSLGQRYARSLFLLWRKSAERVAAVRLEAATASESRVPIAAGANSLTGQVTCDEGDQSAEIDPLRGFSWRDLDGLGQFIGDSFNYVDMTLTTPLSESDQGAAELDTITDVWQDIMWSGNDIIF